MCLTCLLMRVVLLTGDSMILKRADIGMRSTSRHMEQSTDSIVRAKPTGPEVLSLLEIAHTGNTCYLVDDGFCCK